MMGFFGAIRDSMPDYWGGVLWSDLGATLVHETGAGTDILGGALSRDVSANYTLFFKFHLDPLSDAGT